MYLCTFFLKTNQYKQLRFLIVNLYLTLYPKLVILRILYSRPGIVLSIWKKIHDKNRYNPKFYCTKKTIGLYIDWQTYLKISATCKTVVIPIVSYIMPRGKISLLYSVPPNNPPKTYRVRFPVQFINIHHHPPQTVNITCKIILDDYWPVILCFRSALF